MSYINEAAKIKKIRKESFKLIHKQQTTTSTLSQLSLKCLMWDVTSMINKTETIMGHLTDRSRRKYRQKRGKEQIGIISPH